MFEPFKPPRCQHCKTLLVYNENAGFYECPNCDFKIRY